IDWINHSFGYLTCQYCEKKLKTPNGLDDHSHRKHGTERKFPPVFIRRGRRRSRNQIPCDAMSNLNLNDAYHSDSILIEQNPSYNVDKYIKEELQPNEAFHRPYNQDIDALVTLMQADLAQVLSYDIQEVVKSGSLGKGTAVKGNVDVDLVVFLNGFRNQKDFISKSPEIVANLKSFLREAGKRRDMSINIEKTSSSGAVQFKFRRNNGEWHDVDVMAAFDNIRHLGSVERVNAEMARQSEDVRKTYAACLTKEQLEFVRSKPAKVKDLIRLVKHWKETHVTGIPSPKSYGMELLTIEAWKAGGSLQDFNTRKGFYYVLKKLESFGKLWQTQKNSSSILIKDIADPFADVSKRYDHWYELGQKAGKCAKQNLFSDIGLSDRSWY
ncbi:unnamed protein product, partial [Owenia fusiformis]